MYVGGPVWSLDWCPRSHEGPDTKVKSAHPPGSSYHKIGAPLVGRGIIQIWSVLNVHQNKERPRGRPRKKPVDDCTEAKKPKGRPRKKSTNEPVNMITDGLNYISHPTRSIPKDVALPRVMLCLAHNGKVAWDHRMGFLAVLLGNGSLEVWDVPLPHIIKTIYSVSHGEGCDPRFVKLEPIFRCSVPQSGLEWSYSRPHDYILAGCHDGTLLLWKFSTSGSSDTRPLLCFSAETGPIRAISWAPAESGEASEHVILTAGHKGLKFWDLRDPFRPLWEFRTSTKFHIQCGLGRTSKLCIVILRGWKNQTS
ncbi:unnamed protein product [Linum tenue]|uniref:Uncharacterized protein n=1 Tax=Linum tenue TaxID=586396 RepID=A0AAV0QWI9_9ROSI|nr:unnamed protein product [Linum tenue]